MDVRASRGHYVYVHPSFILVCVCVLSLCASMHVIICADVFGLYLCACVRRREKRTGPVKASDAEDRVKTMFDMRKEARSCSTCSIQQQLAQQICL